MIPRIGLGEFTHFLLVVTGISCLVVSTWNVPRHTHTRELGEHRDRLQLHLDQLRGSRDEYRRRRQALATDPHFREQILRQVIRARRPHEMTLREWLGRQGDPTTGRWSPKDAD